MRCLYSGHMLTFLAPYRCQLSSCSSCRELALHAGRVQYAWKQRSTREYALTACALASRARRRLWPRSSLTAAITAAALTTAAAAAAASVVPPPPQKPTPPPSARHRPPASSLAAHASTVAAGTTHVQLTHMYNLPPFLCARARTRAHCVARVAVCPAGCDAAMLLHRRGPLTPHKNTRP